MKLATRRQLEYISKLTGKWPEFLLSFNQASALIEQLKTNKKRRGGKRGGGKDREEAYIEKAFNDEIDLLKNTTSGGRNNQLFASAVRLFELASASRHLSISEVERALEGACNSNGLITDDGLASVERTIRSALSHAGTATLPDFSTTKSQPKSYRLTK